jgi:quercetin dioxygenase-like cupin family protein
VDATAETPWDRTIAVSLATFVGVAAATLSSGVTVEPIAAGTLARNFKVRQQAGDGVVIARFTIEPGGTTGWHTHPGKTLVVVQSGELTLRRAIEDECRTRTYGPGEGFVEIAPVVHSARNRGDTPLVLGATFFRVPPSGVTRIDQPKPEVC